MSSKELKNIHKPWITKEIIHPINKNNKLFSKYLKCKDVDRKQILFSEYKLLKNNLLQEQRIRRY